MDSTTQRLMTSAGGPVDPFFENVTMLLHGDGTNGAQNNTFLDSSSNNFTITRNGNTTQGAFGPYGDRWSNYFDGTGDYLSFASSTAFALPGAFTFECWFYPNSFDQVSSIGDTIASGIASGSFTFGRTASSHSNAWGIAETGIAWRLTSTTLPTNGAWNHLVAVRDSSNNTALFLNGVRVANGTVTTSFTQNGLSIASDNGIANSFVDGYISNARLVKGSAVYDPVQSTLTVPTAPLTAITNTSLLTCQSNRFIDNSSNNFSITRNGDVSVQPFSPFSPSAAYSAFVSGGSGYFDGTGDYLETSINNAIISTTGDFTAEAWVYITSATTDKTIFYLRGNNTTYAALRLGITASTSQVFLLVSTNGSGWQILSGALTSLSLRTWNHIAVTRNGGTFSVYINGASAYTSNAISAGTALMTGSVNWVGAMNNSGVDQPFLGYISNLRVVNGTSVYTAAFTPPTAPLTAITNASLLLNFTNAGIVDNAADSVLETVGNAQISTSVRKYGTGSLAFDGSGDYLTVPASQNVNFGTGNFTVEFWLYATSNPAYVTIIDNNYSTAPNFTVQPASGTMILFLNGSSVSLTDSTGAVTTGTWNHFAFVRNGTTVTMYRNGNSVASTTYSGNVGNASVPYFIGGSLGGGGYYLNGYIDDLRITKGVARYTANFTAPAGPFPDM